MDIYELMKQTREKYDLSRQPKLFSLSCGMEPDDIPNSVDRLQISLDYQGELPALSRFERLRDFMCSANLSSKEIERMDLSKLEKLSINLQEQPGDLKIKAPELKELYIRFDPGSGKQLSFVNCNPYTVDLTELSSLQKLSIRNCIFPCNLQISRNEELTGLFFYDSEFDFEAIPEIAPNIRKLSLCKCDLTDISFVEKLKYLTSVDLSYNEITDISGLTKLQGLTEVSLYRNPVNPSVAGEVSCGHMVLTEKDKQTQNFLSTLELDAYFAFLSVRGLKDPQKKRAPALQRLMAETPEETLFSSRFAEKVKLSISKNRNLSRDELTKIAIDEYPFLHELIM